MRLLKKQPGSRCAGRPHATSEFGGPQSMSIPKKLHIVWVGNSNKAPLECIESWRRNHAAWQIKLWNDSHLEEESWINTAHLRAFACARQWPAVADLMRYEILYREGGIYVD